MALKLVFFLVMALFATQATADESNPAVYSLLDDIKKIIDGLIKLVSDSIISGTEKLSEAIKAIVAASGKIIETSMDGVNGIISSYVGAITTLVAEAAAIGIDAEDCLGDNMDTLKAIPETLRQEMNKCAADQVENANEVVDVTLKAVNDILQQITLVEEELFECKPLDLICLGKVMATASGLAVTVPIRILKLIDDGVDIIMELPKEVVSCVNGVVGGPISKANELNKAMTECIKDKINSSSNTGILDDIKKIIDGLIEAVSDGIISATEMLSEAIKLMVAEAGKVVETSLDEVNQIISSYVGAITKLVAEAAAMGINATDCLDNNMDKLEAIPEALRQEMNKCVADQVDNANEMVDITIKAVNDILQQVKQVEEDLFSCKPLDIICLGKVLATASSLAVTVPQRIEKLKMDAFLLILDLPKQVIVCVGGVVTGPISKANDLHQAMTKCIKDKISSSSNTTATYGILDDAKKIIDGLIEAVSDGVISATEMLSEAIKAVVAEAGRIVEMSLDGVNQIIAGYVGAVTKLVAEAAIIGINATDCLDGNIPALEAIPESLLQELNICVSDQVENANKMVDITLKAINDILQQVKLVEAELFSCKPLDIICLGRVLATASGLALTVPARIVKLKMDAINLIMQLPKQIISCVNGVVGGPISYANELHKAMTECINDKMNPNTVLTPIIA